MNCYSCCHNLYTNLLTGELYVIVTDASLLLTVGAVQTITDIASLGSRRLRNNRSSCCLLVFKQYLCFPSVLRRSAYTTRRSRGTIFQNCSFQGSWRVLQRSVSCRIKTSTTEQARGIEFNLISMTRTWHILSMYKRTRYESRVVRRFLYTTKLWPVLGKYSGYKTQFVTSKVQNMTEDSTEMTAF